mgnify:CR=1 FL=1
MYINLKNLNYEDYCDFIADFINDTKLLFMNCNNIQFKNIMNDYNVDENLFDNFIRKYNELNDFSSVFCFILFCGCYYAYKQCTGIKL